MMQLVVRVASGQTPVDPETAQVRSLSQNRTS
jgi:hypothetical protein